MASGLIRLHHLEVLRCVGRGDCRRDVDFEYRLPRRGRHVSEAVYILEQLGHVVLSKDGTVEITDRGRTFLAKRGVTLGPEPVRVQLDPSFAA